MEQLSQHPGDMTLQHDDDLSTHGQSDNSPVSGLDELSLDDEAGGLVESDGSLDQAGTRSVDTSSPGVDSSSPGVESGMTESPPPVPSVQDFLDRGEAAQTRLDDLMARDLCGCDMLWSLFVSAARSYRFSSILHPFPPMFCSGSEDSKNIVELRDSICQVARFSADSQFVASLPEDSKQLVSWVLQSPAFSLRLRDRSQCFNLIKRLTGQVMNTAVPSYIFEVVFSQQKELRFEELRHARPTFHAYHGSRLDNFYSILHNGLNSHMNKVSLFGEGTYLSSELSMSLLYSPAGEGWRSSCLGTQLSCVAVCQMIDDPSVRCQVKKGDVAQRAQASPETDAVPEKYYVVQNNDMIRVKYLLVYRHDSPAREMSRKQSSYSWLQKHRFSLLMLAYFLLLVAVGLANSRYTISMVWRTVVNTFC